MDLFGPPRRNLRITAAPMMLIFALFFLLPLVFLLWWMRRGFIASGISRTSSIARSSRCSREFTASAGARASCGTRDKSSGLRFGPP